MATKPSKYSKARADRFVAAVSIGATYRAASAAAGVHEDTAANWRRDNAGFSARVREAEQLREVGWLNCIKKAVANGDAKIAIQMLKMTNPAVYAQQAVRIDGPVNVAGTLSLSKKLDDLTSEQLARLADGE